ncbi:hypothetical protein cce_1094 [Crocosphaera subtropica ATCC 51142]|uniref:DUF29 domain-containing protein n=1 Tax=Crocosphaera subtropica (strain ATCC 51142 / BH68) TaxID=43989 RepID=B1WTX8_CROS5|nr:DUF29 domain-containing protein [Crocosphaera subtropica]ACB50444.1 hypothetical protein cce_1094 [Crocosphaera subtropica ATCC 51142]
MNKLYDIDFNLWSKKQAQLLREGKFHELDIEHLIEEVEDLGKSEYKTCRSYTILIIIHLLCINYWEVEKEYNEKHWQREVYNFRILLKKNLSTSIKNKLIENWQEIYQEAAQDFKEKTNLIAPESCPFAIEDILQ